MQSQDNDKNKLFRKIITKSVIWLASNAGILFIERSPMNLMNSTLIKNEIALGQMTNSSVNYIAMQAWKYGIPVVIVLLAVFFTYSIGKDIVEYIKNTED